MNSKYWLIVCFAVFVLTTTNVPRSQAATGAMLPSGYLSTNGNQIVDQNGNPVRLACTGLFDWSSEGSTTIAGDFQGIAAAGFNCVRYPWYDATLNNDLAIVDKMVAAADQYGIKIILDHHGNEATANSSGTDNGPAYPCNGLWYDVGYPNPVNGCPAGHYTSAQVIQNWQTVAQHYAGNTTVIGFDLQNEPHLAPSYWSVGPGGATWGDGSTTDIRQYYSSAAAAIEAVDPGVLIICMGVGKFAGETLFNGQAMIIPESDLTLAASQPVTTLQHKLVYTTHYYPAPIGGTSPDSGSTFIESLNQSFGFLVSQNLYPVWIGELGASLDGTNDSYFSNLADEQAWAGALVGYLNGQYGAQGGPTFSGTQQGIGTDWWAWGYLNNESPDGTLTSPSQTSLNQAQYAVYSQLQFHPTISPSTAMGTVCAREGGTCSFTGTRSVTFGAGTSYITLVETASVACNNVVFSDPDPGVGKACYVGVQAPTATAASAGTLCAQEGGRCSFSGTKLITFGAGTSYDQRVETNGVLCSNTTFTDPDPYVVKACYVGNVP